jgi:hypothetical protein
MANIVAIFGIQNAPDGANTDETRFLMKEIEKECRNTTNRIW